MAYDCVRAELMPALPTVTSWGQLFLVVCGIVLAIKYIFPLVKNGNGKEDFRELRSALTLIVAQQAALLETTKVHTELLRELLAAITRRGT